MTEIAGIQRNKEIPKALFSPTNVRAFSRGLKEKMLDPLSPFAKRYLRLLVDKIRVEEKEVCIRGNHAKLAQAMAQKKSGHPGRSARIRLCLAPRMCRSTNRQTEPEVWFRVVHTAQNGHNDAPVAAYRDQRVEIALGPKGAFENGNIGTLTRRVATDSVISGRPPRRGKLKPPREPKTPRVVKLLHKAIEWQALLESGRIASQAEVARREGISRARVTQVMGMLRLAPEIQEQIQSMPDVARRHPVTERALRPIETISARQYQVKEFHKLLA